MVDIISSPTDESLMPAAVAFFLTPWTPPEERDNGVYDYIKGLYEKQNVHYLGRSAFMPGFYIFTNVKVENPREFSGLKIRTSPTFDPFLKALGAAGVSMSMPEQYTAMERGVIDGWTGTLRAISAFKLQEVTKYRINHKFYGSNTYFLFNLDSWNRLSKKQQDVITEIAINIEHELVSFYTQVDNDMWQMSVEAGMENIEFSSADAQWYVDLADTSAWEEVKKTSPEHYDKFKELMTK